jgi:hypothetical protein
MALEISNIFVDNEKLFSDICMGFMGKNNLLFNFIQFTFRGLIELVHSMKMFVLIF